MRNQLNKVMPESQYFLHFPKMQFQVHNQWVMYASQIYAFISGRHLCLKSPNTLLARCLRNTISMRTKILNKESILNQ